MTGGGDSSEAVGAALAVRLPDAKLEIVESGAETRSELRQRGSGQAREVGLDWVDLRSWCMENPVVSVVRDGFLDDSGMDSTNRLFTSAGRDASID